MKRNEILEICEALNKDILAKPCEKEVEITALMNYIDDLHAIIDEVHTWMVCSKQSSTKYVMENLSHILDITDPDYTLDPRPKKTFVKAKPMLSQRHQRPTLEDAEDLLAAQKASALFVQGHIEPVTNGFVVNSVFDIIGNTPIDEKLNIYAGQKIVYILKD